MSFPMLCMGSPFLLCHENCSGWQLGDYLFCQRNILCREYAVVVSWKMFCKLLPLMTCRGTEPERKVGSALCYLVASFSFPVDRKKKGEQTIHLIWANWQINLEIIGCGGGGISSRLLHWKGEQTKYYFTCFAETISMHCLKSFSGRERSEKGSESHGPSSGKVLEKSVKVSCWIETTQLITPS